MHLSRRIWVLVFAGVLLGGAAADAGAQVLGTFRWRMAPYCNVLTLTAVQYGPAIQVSGFDDKCGLQPRDPVTGSVFLDGAAGVGHLGLIDTDGLTSTIRFTVNLSSLSGTWVDNSDRGGDFTFNPSAAPGDMRPIARDLWAYVVASGIGFHATSGGLSLTHPATGEYCIVLDKRYSHKAAQVTLASPGGTEIVSVGTGHGSACNPLIDEEHNVVPVYVSTPNNAPADANFTIFIPAR